MVDEEWQRSVNPFSLRPVQMCASANIYELEHVGYVVTVESVSSKIPMSGLSGLSSIVGPVLDIP